MSTIAALFLLADAAHACGAGAPERPRIVADAVQAVLDLDPQAQAMPELSLTAATRDLSTDAEPEPAEPPAQCGLRQLPIA